MPPKATTAASLATHQEENTFGNLPTGLTALSPQDMTGQLREGEARDAQTSSASPG